MRGRDHRRCPKPGGSYSLQHEVLRTAHQKPVGLKHCTRLLPGGIPHSDGSARGGRAKGMPKRPHPITLPPVGRSP